MPIDVQQAAQMWQSGAASQQASQKYAAKTAGKGALQKDRSLAAEPTYQAKMAEVISTGARAAGVSRQDPSAYERGIQTKGIQNRIAGIQAAGAGKWAAGFSPYAPTIDSVRAGFGPKSADVMQNVTQRVGAIATALHNQKVSGGGSGYSGGAAVGGAGGVVRGYM